MIFLFTPYLISDIYIYNILNYEDSVALVKGVKKGHVLSIL